MGFDSHCLIQIDSGNDISFIGYHGEYTTDLQAAMIYPSELDALLYIDKHGLEQLATVRRISYSDPQH